MSKSKATMFKFQIACYISEMPNHHKLSRLLIGLQKLIPSAIDKYEIINWAGKERRGKYDEATLGEKLQVLPIQDLSFVSIHTKMREEHANVPQCMISVARRFLEDNPIAGVYIDMPATDEIDYANFSEGVFKLIASCSDVCYGFGTEAPYRNVDFDYGSASAMYVDRKTKGYLIVEDLSDRLMENPSTLDPVMEGSMVRSVYPVNSITRQLAEKINQVLNASSGINAGVFSPLADERELWIVSDVVEREKIFRKLQSEGVTLECDWLDLKTYQPRFATIDDVVI